MALRAMSDRVFNFSAGPSTLPLPVLERAAAELTCYQETGVSILELGHRTKTFKGITQQATDRIRTLLNVPANYEVFFVQGGGRLVFSVLPMNFCNSGRQGNYLVTGSWGRAAYAEASQASKGHCIWDGAEQKYSTLPAIGSLATQPDAAYLHYTSNETIEGVQFASDLGSQLDAKVPIICDMSSDFMSRPIEIQNYDLAYACIQKNLGPAGATLIIAKREFLEQADEGLPGYLRLLNHAEAGSMYNTPPTFCIYIANLVLEWFESEFGTLEAVGAFNREKATKVYSALERFPNVFQLHAEPSCRSQMNITFRLNDENREKRFLEKASERNLAYLAGHRSVGGIRASLYNAMPMAGADALTQFILDFAAQES